MMIESSLRNASSDGLRKWFVGMIAVGLMQFGATIWWASNLNATVQMIGIRVSDHEERLRVEERKP